MARLKKKKSKKSRAKHAQPHTLLSSWKLLGGTVAFYKLQARVVAGIMLIHLLVLLVFLRDSSSTTGLASLLVGLIVSLSYIWVSRQNNKDTQPVLLSDAMYLGPAQIVPFTLLVSMIVLQLLPFAIGAFIFQIGVSGGVAVYFWEQALFGALWLVLSLPSLYWITSTIFSLVLIGIPGIRPLEAWRAAKKLVRPHLLTVAGRLVTLVIIVLGLLYGVLLVAFNFENHLVATYGSTVIGVLLLPFAWAYIFELYKDLLDHE